MKKIDEYPGDRMLLGDEWDHVRYLIREEIKSLEVMGEVKFGKLPLPFFAYFEHAIKDKLIKAGFKKDIIDNQKRFGTVLNGLNNQGKTIYGARGDVWKYPPWAWGYPADVVILKDDKSMYWIKPDIEAALRTLESITIMKGLLVNKEAVNVCLRSLELTVNLLKAGNVPGLAVSEANKKENSLKRRELKKEVMRCIVENIFKKKPHRPKTLGEVWNKIDRGYERICSRKTKKEYIVRTGKNKKGKDIVKIAGHGTEPFEYSKRSLQHFIDELKNTPLKVTQ